MHNVLCRGSKGMLVASVAFLLCLPQHAGGWSCLCCCPSLWRYVSSGQRGQASALAVIMTVMLLVVDGLARRFVRTRLGT
jgi:hypothetical protein